MLCYAQDKKNMVWVRTHAYLLRSIQRATLQKLVVERIWNDHPESGMHMTTIQNYIDAVSIFD